MPHKSSRIARFGQFELDLSAGELRKSGVKLRLQGQPFQVLALLLERAGEVVTREELQQKLWPSDTFVDFDHSLNTAINKVREALGEHIFNKFIENKKMEWDQYRIHVSEYEIDKYLPIL